VKKYIDIMAIHKLNVLHWHLTDDQGWRLEIKKYPQLTEHGAIRKQTIIGHGRDRKGYDNTPYGEGFYYTQDQVKEIIDYAAAKGIEIIPEIDLPGHMLAALACFPELGCTGGPYDVWGRWGIADDVLCVGKEETMKFLEDVLAEVADLFPSEYVHIGGDECPKVRWETCPHCQAKIAELGLKDDDKHKAEHYLQSYVTNRMEQFLSTKGKKIIGWDEILEGEIAPNATVMSWRGVEGGLEAVRMGHDAIMVPYTHLYLDYYQSKDKENEPLAIGGYVPVELVYSFEPFTEDMTDEEKSHILGIQANLWTEYIPTDAQLEYMLLPRLSALSEIQWCEPENKDYERFLGNMESMRKIYDILGYNYAKHIFTK
jgi:hexosaminidase